MAQVFLLLEERLFGVLGFYYGLFLCCCTSCLTVSRVPKRQYRTCDILSYDGKPEPFPLLSFGKNLKFNSPDRPLKLNPTIKRFKK